MTIMTIRKVVKQSILALLMTALFIGGAGLLQPASSANLTGVKVTLSTPRLSFHGVLGAGNTVGSTVITLASTGAPSTGTYNLFVGDTVKIGAATSQQVIDVNDGQTFQIAAGLAAGDADASDPVIVVRKADMVVDFTTVSAISGGKYRVLVPAATSNNSDGTPDEDGWDGDTTASLGAITVTCPNAEVAVKTAGVSVDGATYHSFVCPTTGLIATGAKQITIAGLINPSPNTDAPAHTVGLADQYRIIVEHQDAAGTIIDRTTAAVALIEAVRITASVAPSIELQLLPLGNGVAACDIASTSVATTATQVPLGELNISAFKTAAQQIKVSTNAQNGYVVTGVAEDQLRRKHIAGGCTGNGDSTAGCIRDSAGDGSQMTMSASDEWNLPATKGFAYSLQYVSGTVGTPAMAFQHNVSGSGGQCSGANCYRQFADAQAAEVPVELFSSTSVADSHLVNVCYKAVIGATQEAGEDYATNVTYRATATF